MTNTPLPVPIQPFRVKLRVTHALYIGDTYRECGIPTRYSIHKEKIKIEILWRNALSHSNPVVRQRCVAALKAVGVYYD